MNTSHRTRVVQVGGVKIGGANPIVVQSMTNTNTRNPDSTLDQIRTLASRGCQLIRVAVPDEEAGDSLNIIVDRSPLPVIADIHFDWQLALTAISAGVDKLRLNPGNIREKKGVRKVARRAKSAGIPIRVGVNSGSLSPSVVDKFSGRTAKAMVHTAEQEISILKEAEFEDIVVSLKSSSVPVMIEANRLFARKFDYPLHLGVTEAGSGQSGAVKSAMGIGTLLEQGIGDTIRVSLTGSPKAELLVAYEILRSLDLRDRGPEVVSCPTCGRTEIDVAQIAESVKNRLGDLVDTIRISVMGCVVNGVGEAEESHVGLVGTPKGGILYKDGEKIGVVDSKDEETLASRVEELARKVLKKKVNNGEEVQQN